MNNVKSIKEEVLEGKVLELLQQLVTDFSMDSLPIEIVKTILADQEIQAIHDYANIVSITRLGFNDHGPVHMKTVCYNALKMIRILHEAGVQTSLEQEDAGNFSDSVAAVCIAALLHDAGMTIARKNHELYSGIMTFQKIREILAQALPNDVRRRTVIQSMALEGIIGHMTTNPIHSIEAGLILIADGCDMTKGRARIPMEIPSKPAEGDIHKYSANSIEKVRILHGSKRPIKLEVHMKSEVGFFQVEEVLIPKIQSSPAKHLIELYAGVEGQDLKCYI